jgi:hypothetical protein
LCGWERVRRSRRGKPSLAPTVFRARNASPLQFLGEARLAPTLGAFRAADATGGGQPPWTDCQA